MKRRDLEMSLNDLFEGNLRGEAFDALAEELRNNAEARSVYREYALLDHSLRFRNAGVDLMRVVPMDQVVQRRQKRFVKKALVSAAAILMLCATILMLTRGPDYPLIIEVGPGTVYDISHKDDQEKKVEGEVLLPGSSIEVAKGVVELRFASGVKGIVQAPASLTLQREDFVELSRGTVWFHVPNKAVGFQVSTPSLLLTDLGTEFGIISQPGYLDQVHVFEGRVRVESFHPSSDSIVIRAKQAYLNDPGKGWLETEAQKKRFLNQLPEREPEASPLVAQFFVEPVNGNPHEGPVITAASGDVLEKYAEIQSASSSPGSGIRGQHDPRSLLNGKIQIGNQDVDISHPDNTNAVFAAATGDYLQFDLNTSKHPEGFDVMKIRTIARWLDDRSRQAWTLQIRTVGGEFEDVYSLAPTDGKGQVTMLELSNEDGAPLATGVDGIRFNFAFAASNWTAYREIDIIGEPSR